MIGRKDDFVFVLKDGGRERTRPGAMELRPAKTFGPGHAEITNAVPDFNPPSKVSNEGKPVLFRYDAEVSMDRKLSDVYAILPAVVNGSICTEILPIGSIGEHQTKHVHFDYYSKVESIGFLHIFSAGVEIMSSQVKEPYDATAYFDGLMSKSKGISATALCKSQNEYAMSLSTDGNHLAEVVDRGDHFGLVIFDLSSMKVANEIAVGSLRAPVEDMHWVSPTELIYLKGEDKDDFNSWERTGSGFIQTSDLYFVNITDNKPTKLVSNVHSLQRLSTPNPYEVMLRFDHNGTWHEKYDVQKRKTLSSYTENEACTLYFNRLGEPRLKYFYNHDHLNYFYRPTATSEWKSLDESVKQAGLRFNIHGDELIDRVADIFALGPDGDTLYIASRVNSDKYELDAFSMKDGVIKYTIARHPKYDIGGDFNITRFFYREKTGQLLGILYNEEKPKIVWLDRHFAACQAAIDHALPDHTNAPIDYTDDGSTLLYFSSSDKDPGAYYLFRPQTGSLIPVRTLRDHLKGKSLASTIPFTFQSRDGAIIHAYLTEPVEKSNTPPPLIVDIHGGPSVRDMWGFNPSTQFFASRGYAVLQVNYRGSAGYGAAYQKAGLRARLDTVVIDDVADGVKYLIDQKKVDPSRIGVTGGSFGGYSVYMSLIKYPQLYRAGVAIAAVSHWATLEQHDFLGDNFDYAYMHNLTGESHFSENEKFIDPYLRASEIKQPIYIMHGERDTTVRVQQAEMMYKALKKTNSSVKFMRFGMSSHQYWDLADRITVLNESGDFFAENLKPMEKAPTIAQK